MPMSITAPTKHGVWSQYNRTRTTGGVIVGLRLNLDVARSNGHEEVSDGTPGVTADVREQEAGRVVPRLKEGGRAHDEVGRCHEGLRGGPEVQRYSLKAVTLKQKNTSIYYSRNWEFINNLSARFEYLWDSLQSNLQTKPWYC